MLKLSIQIFTLLCLMAITSTYATDSFSLYLVRHAEKQTQTSDPKLTRCGTFRAKQLATILSEANIKRIYSTGYQRTMATAAPLARTKNIAVKNYDPRKLAQLAHQLMLLKENALIVGHSNTTPQLAELLSDIGVKAIAENEYQMLYQIQFLAGKSTLIVLKQPLQCQ